MTEKTIGFLGFGEAASLIAEGLAGEGATGITAFDTRSRPEVKGVTMADSLEDLLDQSDIVFAAVTSAVALTVAKEAAPFLNERHLYVDINSVSPETKIAVGKIIAGTGAGFVEASVMAAVPGKGHKVPMLLSGEAAPDLINVMVPLGMVMEDFGPELGRAAATKMLRSVMIKGMEALFQECVLATERYGVSKPVMESIADGYPGIDWDKLASYLIGRTALHGERRAHEMEEVAATLKSIGIEPLMAGAAAKRLHWAADQGLQEKFGGTAPESYREVAAVLLAALEKSGNNNNE